MEILRLSTDFNARTKCLHDFFEYDEYNFDSFNSLDNSEVRLENQKLLEGLGFEFSRISQDNETSNNGYELAELCKNTDIFMWMAELVMMLILENLQNVNVMDYALASPSLFPDICHFDVLPFNNTFQIYVAPFMLKSGKTIVNTLMLELKLLIILVNKSIDIGDKNFLKYFHLTWILVGFMNYID